MINRGTACAHPVVAAIYDPATKIAERLWFRDHREYVVRELEGNVLDLGAGTGAMFPYFADATETRPLDVHAIEPDPHMRQRAERKATELDLEVSIQSARAKALPYEANTFDAVVASLVFCTIADVDTALEEVARVLKPTGELRFFEHVRSTGLRGRLQDVTTPLWRRVAGGCHLNRNTDVVFAEDHRFEPREIEYLNIGILPVKPFVQGVLTPVNREAAALGSQ
jgi:ubiquinone/menaquinone biosynthesis C-methylase UbiE